MRTVFTPKLKLKERKEQKYVKLKGYMTSLRLFSDLLIKANLNLLKLRIRFVFNAKKNWRISGHFICGLAPVNRSDPGKLWSTDSTGTFISKSLITHARSSYLIVYVLLTYYAYSKTTESGFHVKISTIITGTNGPTSFITLFLC